MRRSPLFMTVTSHVLVEVQGEVKQRVPTHLLSDHIKGKGGTRNE